MVQAKMVRELIGWSLIAAPFVGVFAIALKTEGLLVAFGIFAVAAAVYASIAVGVWMVHQ